MMNIKFILKKWFKLISDFKKWFEISLPGTANK